MKTWVKWYRDCGINIFPLKKREKVPQIAWDDFKKRETTEREVEEWLARGVRNFGAVCGSISNDLFVIDVDRKELFSKLKLRELASDTFTVKTGRGYHIYLRMPDPKKKGLVWEGREEIRFQGEGKYVVCADSIHPSGTVYEHLSPSRLEIKKADPTLLDEIEQRWKKYHGIDKFEEKREEVKLKTKRSNLLENFKRRVSLTDVITRYVEKVNDFGTYWRGYCPFHDENNPSFIVYESTKSFYCYGCDQWGDVINFIEMKENKGFFDAIKQIERMTGINCLVSMKKTKGDNQAAKLYPSDVEEMIRAERRFATLRDTGDVLHYEDTIGGVWRFDAEVIIREKTQKVLKDLERGEEPTRYFVGEVIGNVQRETYINRDYLNSEKKKINLLNGVYDLETCKLLQHDAGYYFTSLVPVRYDAAAKCQEIEKFLKEILHEDDIRTVLQFIGYCLLPIMPYHKAMMFLGEGANGKSTLIELIRIFLGEKNTTTHSLQSLLEGRFETADLYGKLANLYADIPKYALRETGKFKVLTGGDMLSAERKFKDPFSFKNTTKLIFSANVLPESLDDTDAFFRRWLLINFPNKFEGEQCDPEKLEKLTTPEELSGFFNLVLDALKQLLRDRMFHNSKPANEIREEYEDKSNPVLSFVKNCIECEESFSETKDDIYSAFLEFCKERKLQTIAKNMFAIRLQQYAKVRAERKRIKGKQVRCWRGIRLKEEEEEIEESKKNIEQNMDSKDDSLVFDEEFQLKQAKQARAALKRAKEELAERSENR